MKKKPVNVDASRRQFLGWTGGIGAAVLLSACTAPDSSSSSSSSSGPAKEVDGVAFDYPFTFLPVYAGVTKFAKQRASELGIKMTSTNDQGKPDLQATNVDALIAQNVSSIVSFPMIIDAMEVQAKKALDAGIVWVSYGGSMKNQSASIEFSFEKGGRLLGEHAAAWAVKELGGKGKIAFLIDETVQLGRERTKGMVESFTAAAPGIEVVAKEQAIDPDTALTKMTAILAQHPDVNLVLGVTDGASFGAYKALEKAGRKEGDAKTYVGGQDGDLGSLQLIQKGTFYRASAALQLKDIGAAVIDVPVAVGKGKSDKEASVDVPIALVVQGDPLLAQIISQYS